MKINYLKHKKRIALLVGSLERKSFSQSLAKYLISVAPESLTFEICKINQLNLYNEDLEINPPKNWVKFREKIKKFDGFIFITPEINKSMSGSLINAISVASRPFLKNAFDGKPAAIVTITNEPANKNEIFPHLKQSLLFLNLQTMIEPQACIRDSKKVFDENGNLANTKTLKFISNFMSSFDKWVHR